jgi:hypothetical protein
MPTKRTRRSRGRQAVVTPQILEMYRRLYDLEHSNLPDDAPERMPWGEIDMLHCAITAHFDLHPAMPYEEFEALGDRLAAAVGLKRRSDDGYKLV